MQSSSLLTEAREPIVMGLVWDSRSCSSSPTIIRAPSFWRTLRQSEEAAFAPQSRFRLCNNAETVRGCSVPFSAVAAVPLPSFYFVASHSPKRPDNSDALPPRLASRYRISRRSIRTTGLPGLLASLRLPHPPCQIAQRNAFADERDAKQRAEKQDRGHRHAGPKIKRQQDADDPAYQDPAPVREWPDGERKDDLRNSLDHQEHDQKKRERNYALGGVAKEERSDDDEQSDRNKLQPEMRHAAGVDQADTLGDAAYDQEPSEKDNQSDRRHRRMGYRQDAGHHHQRTLEHVPERVALDLFAHRLAHHLSCCINRHRHDQSPSGCHSLHLG